MNFDNVGPGKSVRSRTNFGGGSVRAVDDNLHARQAVRHRECQVIQVALRRIHRVGDASYGIADRSFEGQSQEALDLVFDLVGELHTTTGEELDPVVGHRVMRRREHHTKRRVGLRCQIRNGRSRQHAHSQDVDTSAGKPCANSCFEELAAGSWIPANDRCRPAIAITWAQNSGCGNSEI